MYYSYDRLTAYTIATYCCLVNGGGVREHPGEADDGYAVHPVQHILQAHPRGLDRVRLCHPPRHSLREQGRIQIRDFFWGGGIILGDKINQPPDYRNVSDFERTKRIR